MHTLFGALALRHLRQCHFQLAQIRCEITQLDLRLVVHYVHSLEYTLQITMYCFRLDQVHVKTFLNNTPLTARLEKQL